MGPIRRSKLKACTVEHTQFELQLRLICAVKVATIEVSHVYCCLTNVPIDQHPIKAAGQRDKQRKEGEQGGRRIP